MTVSIKSVTRRAIQVAFMIAAFAIIALAMPQVAHANGHKGLKAATTKFHGKVTAVSATSITLHSKKTNTDETLAVTPTTKVKVEKVAAAIGDVTVGMHAAVESADGKTADAVHAHAKKDKVKSKNK